MNIRVWTCVAMAAVTAASISEAAAQGRGQKPRSVGPGLVEVTVRGQGMSQQEAMNDAKRKAVERGAGAEVFSNTTVQDFVLIKDTILTRAAGFVQSVKIDGKPTESEDGVWEIRVKAVVSVKGIVHMWGAVTMLLQEKGHPKIMVFIDEKMDKTVVQNSTVQTRIENVLLKSGFRLVDRNQVKAIRGVDLSAAAAEDKPAKIQAIAKRFGAQLFIVGKAYAVRGANSRAIPGVRLYAYEAEANIRCFRTDTGQLLSSIPSQPGLDTRGVQRVWRLAAKQSLDGVGKQVVPKVRRDILRFWQDALSGRGEVILEVSGMKFMGYVRLRKALPKIQGVKSLNTGSTTFANKVARISMNATVAAEPLAMLLAEKLEAMIEIEGLSANVIKAKYIGK